MKALLLFTLLLATTATHAQQAGVDCVPVQGQGWSGCDPNYQPQSQQPQTQQMLPQIWVDHYGAMVSDDSLGKLGVATDKQSESAAWQTAEEDCHAKGGLNCTRLISYHNECVAMVLGDKTYSFSAGLTEADAVQQATKKCTASSSNCHVYYSACSLPNRIQ
ncbi:DUF4189 domain-containing protein [Rhodanobacter hydrolyticus]|uniref:DUF4189 domain-containing protein n=1 Tax=Rhodanobacter hydrolyticus TaxID=2250595 RepID=A0ABW8J5G2_9GAMM